MKGRRPVSADELVAHAAFVRRVARRLVGTAADADDVAQDALLALWQRGAPQTGRRAWLTAIVRNLARLSWRRDARRRQRERAAARHEAGSMPDVVLARAEWHRRLAGEVAHLPEPECTAIVLRYYDGLSAAEAARRLGVTPTTIRNRCRRALSRMRATLGERHGSAWMPALLALAAMPKRATAATIGGTSIMTTKVAIPAAIAACILTGGSTLLLLDDDETGQAAHAGVTSKRPAKQVAQEPRELPAPPKRTVGKSSEVRKESIAEAAARYLRRVREALRVNDVGAIGNEIAHLDPRRGWAILSIIYKDIAEARTRWSLVSGFLNLLDSKGRPKAHPHEMDAVHLLVTDDHAPNRFTGFRHLKHYAFEDFSAAPDRYRRWRETIRRTSLPAAVKEAAQGFVRRLGDMSFGEGMALLLETPKPSGLIGEEIGLDLAGAFRDAGFLDRARAWITPPEKPVLETEQDWVKARAVEPLWRWVDAVRPDDAFLKDVVSRILDAPEEYGPIHTAEAVKVLGRRKPTWGFDRLAPLLTRRPFRPMASTMSLAMLRLGRKRAIPYLIAAVAAVDDAEYTKRICGSGLSQLTRVCHRDKPKSGAWWLRWWDFNKHRLPPEVAAIDPRRIEFIR